MIDGILCIYKPLGISSHTVVSRVRGMTKIKKAGHGGTLDPLADGVLPILLGRATKISDLIACEDKCYSARMRLGVTTDTCDLEGEILTQSEVHVSAVAVAEAVSEFVGEIAQTPPMYSALQVDGVRLYDLAREGIEVDRKERQIKIFSIGVTVLDEFEGEYALEVHCSKGTYIRTLVDDIGRALGCGAVLIGLTRTRCAGFSMEDCITMEQLEQAKEHQAFAEYVLPVETYFKELREVKLADFHRHLICNGCAVSLKKLRVKQEEHELSRLYAMDGAFLGIGKAVLTEDGLSLKMQIGF